MHAIGFGFIEMVVSRRSRAAVATLPESLFRRVTE
jgi:hypothetical protein